MAAIGNIPKDCVAVAQLDGANRWQVFIHVKLRYLSPMITFTTILSLINSFKVFREIYMLTGDYPVDGLYMLQHFMNNTFQSLDYQKLSSAAVVLCLIMIIIIGILLWADDRIGRGIEE